MSEARCWPALAGGWWLVARLRHRAWRLFESTTPGEARKTAVRPLTGLSERAQVRYSFDSWLRTIDGRWGLICVESRWLCAWPSATDALAPYGGIASVLFLGVTTSALQALTPTMLQDLLPAAIRECSFAIYRFLIACFCVEHRKDRKRAER